MDEMEIEMNEQNNIELDNLDALSQALADLASGLNTEDRQTETAVRPRLIKALEVLNKSSLDVGRVLCEYRDAYKAAGNRTWTVTIETIANAIGYKGRTLRRWIKDYQSASQQTSSSNIIQLPSRDLTIIDSTEETTATDRSLIPMTAILGRVASRSGSTRRS